MRYRTYANKLSTNENMRMAWTDLKAIFCFHECTMDYLKESESYLVDESHLADELPNSVIYDLDYDYIKEKSSKVSRPQLIDHILHTCAINHETHHIRQISCSSIGVWLSSQYIEFLNQIMVCLFALETRKCQSFRQPLIKWANMTSQKKYKSASSCKAELLRISRLTKAISDMIGRMKGDLVITIGSLLENSDKEYASNLISEKITSRMGSNEHSSPYGMTLNHLIETEARVIDICIVNIWLNAGIKRDIINEVFNALDVPGYYEPLVYFSKQLSHKNLNSMQLLELYWLTSHVSLFPQLFVKRDDMLMWEDIQPVWRFVRIIEQLKGLKSIPSSPIGDYFSFTEELCAYFNWNTPVEVAALSRKLHNHGAADPFIEDIYDRFLYYYHHIKEHGIPSFLFSIEYKELYERLTPYFWGNRTYILPYNIPKKLNIETAASLIVGKMILQDIAFNVDFEYSRKIHGLMFRDEGDGFEDHYTELFRACSKRLPKDFKKIM